MPDVWDWTPPRGWTRLCVQYLLHRIKRVFVFKLRTRPCVQIVFHEEHLCSSATHWKCSILQNTFKAFNIFCIVGVQIVFYTWTHVLEHVQTFSTWCSNSVPPGESVQCLVFKQCSFPFNTMVFNMTEHVQGVQYLLQFWRSYGVLNLKRWTL